MVDIGLDLMGSDWDDYKSVLNDAHATFHQKVIIWRHKTVLINRYQEDTDSDMINTDLKVLLNYNYRRTWPITMPTDAGEDDEQSIQVLIIKEYLRANELLDTFGNFNYNQDFDRFIIDGTKYKAFGDTAAGQMKSDDVYITIVIKRILLETGSKR